MGIYLLVDFSIHFFNLRLKDVIEVWPVSALSFSKFLSQIYGSFVLLAALVILGLSRRVEYYRDLIFIIGIWAFLHGLVLFYFLISDFFDGFGNYSSLYFYTQPFYTVIEIVEGSFLIVFAVLVIFARVHSNKK